jgi:hypothetical protein
MNWDIAITILWPNDQIEGRTFPLHSNGLILINTSLLGSLIYSIVSETQKARPEPMKFIMYQSSINFTKN